MCEHYAFLLLNIAKCLMVIRHQDKDTFIWVNYYAFVFVHTANNKDTPVIMFHNKERLRNLDVPKNVKYKNIIT